MRNVPPGTRSISACCRWTINFVMAASVQHQSEFDLPNDTSVSCRMVWRVRHDRQELERLGSRFSAIILKKELGPGAVEGMAALDPALGPPHIFSPGKHPAVGL